ncbi:hypothetical protein, partial [Bacteroides sp. 51]|uniref:hypothetical protein n=1 Tax=Bacteroides sp. 51 TaxID=2302938 RepID=UPI0013D1DCBD
QIRHMMTRLIAVRILTDKARSIVVQLTALVGKRNRLLPHRYRYLLPLLRRIQSFTSRVTVALDVTDYLRVYFTSGIEAE